MKYCCDTMKEQLTWKCEKCGPFREGEYPKCGDVVVAIFGTRLILIARNAEYECNFCPWCGKKWEKEDGQ